MNRLRRGNTNSLGLIDAAQNGDVARVKAKLRAGKDVNSKDEVRAGNLRKSPCWPVQFTRWRSLVASRAASPTVALRAASVVLTRPGVRVRRGDRSGDRCRCCGQHTRATWTWRRSWWTPAPRSLPLTRCASAELRRCGSWCRQHVVNARATRPRGARFARRLPPQRRGWAASVAVLTTVSMTHAAFAGRPCVAAPGGIPRPLGSGQAAADQGRQRDRHHRCASRRVSRARHSSADASTASHGRVHASGSVLYTRARHAAPRAVLELRWAAATC